MNQILRKVGDGRNFIPIETLNYLSSVTAPHPASVVSEKYSFFSTMNLINALATQNWLPVLAQEQRIREESRKGYQKHLVRFRQPGSVLSNVGDIAPEIVLTNAHDARSAYVLMAGFFKLACLNGLVVSQGEFGAIRIRHVGYDERDVIDATYKVAEDVPRLVDKIEDYRKIDLKTEEREAFAESALVMRYADEKDEVKREGGILKIGDRTFSLAVLIRPNREQDSSPTLWNTFNTVQEKLIKGSNFERTTRSNNGRIVQRTKVKGITGLNEDIRVNRGLWHLQEELRKIKQG
jgi:hypothetical protein